MSKKEKEIKNTEAVEETAVEETSSAEETPAAEKASEEPAVKEKAPRNTKKLRYGSVSAVTIALVIAVVVILNLICNVLMTRYPIKLDLTPDNRYEISDESIDILRNIDKDVTITVTTTKDYFTQLGAYYKNMYYQNYGIIMECPFEIIPEILEKYSIYAEQGSGSIKVEYIDVNKNPDAIAALSENYNGSITEGNIVFRCGNRVKVLGQSDLMSMLSPAQDSVTGGVNMNFAGEAKLTGAVKSVTDMKPVRAALVTMMDGNSVISGQDPHYYIISSVMKFLSENGYDCTEVDASDDISADEYDLLVLAAPSIDFSQNITAKFSDFLYNDGNYGKNMIYIPNFYAVNLTNIDEFLAEWKIGINGTAVIDEEKNAQVPLTSLQRITYAPVMTIANSDSVGTLPNTTLPIVAPFGRTISILTSNGSAITTEILKSSPTSQAQDLYDTEAELTTGEYSMVVKSRKEIASGVDVHASELLVIGSPFMFDSSVIENTNTYNNANAMLNIINNMTGKEEGVIIADKTIQQTTLSVTTGAAKTIRIIVIFILPALIAIAGVTVLIWRKNK